MRDCSKPSSTTMSSGSDPMPTTRRRTLVPASEDLPRGHRAGLEVRDVLLADREDGEGVADVKSVVVREALVHDRLVGSTRIREASVLHVRQRDPAARSVDLSEREGRVE